MVDKRTDWVHKTYSITGGWRIQAADGEIWFELDDDFQTNPGPDVKLFLTKKPLQDITNREMVADHGLFISDISSFVGAQRYRLPVDDLTPYRAIVFHCERYSVVWGGVELPS